MKDNKKNHQAKDLEKPETFTNHIDELTKTTVSSQDNILSQLLDQFEKVDFESLANVNKTENFKLLPMHSIVISISTIIQKAKDNGWDLCKCNGIIYLYNSAYWEEVDKEKFKKFLSEAAEKMADFNIKAKYHKYRKELYEQYISGAYHELRPPDNNRVLINFQNGTFEISSEGTRLRDFNSADFLTYQLPFKYNPEAEAPIFKSFLDKVLPDKECQMVLAEFLGFVFTKHGSNHLKEEKALLLYGTGANGKSVFFEVVNALLGEANISHYSLENLTESKGFFRVKIKDKLLNYASEISGKMNAAAFKQLVSGEPIEAAAKYGQPFTMKHYAKLIFNCNHLPENAEHTNAYFRRLLIIPFKVTIPEHEQDKNLHNKIIDNELSGVFNWILTGLGRLLRQKHFTDCEAGKQAVKKYKTKSDSVQMFLDEHKYKNSATNAIPLDDIFSEYNCYCNDNGIEACSKKSFSRRLVNLAYKRVRRNFGVAFHAEKEK